MWQTPCSLFLSKLFKWLYVCWPFGRWSLVKTSSIVSTNFFQNFSVTEVNVLLIDYIDRIVMLQTWVKSTSVVTDYCLTASLVQIFFDHELAVMLSGSPEVDIEDWKKITSYTGCFNEGHQACIWAPLMLSRAALLLFSDAISGKSNKLLETVRVCLFSVDK